MLLQRLTLAPHVAALVPLLDARGVRTTEQVILTRADSLLALLSPTAAEKASLAAALHELYIASVSRVPVERGHVILAQLGDRQDEEGEGEGQAIFGLSGLDTLLGTRECVIQLCGPKGVAKSLLALHAALRALSDPEVSVRWVDTEGAFNAARAQAVLNHLGLETTVLDRLTVSSLFRLEPELFDVLDEVRADPTTRVLVIDNIASLLRDALMGATAQGHAAMVTVMNEISELTYTRGLLTIITNSPASSVPSNSLSTFSSTAIKPSLGSSLSFETDVEILLQDTGRVFGLADQGERDRASSAPGLRVLAEVLKSRVSPSGTWTVFETDGTTLLDVLPPPLYDAATLARSAGVVTGRPALGGLAETLEPAIAPLRERR